MLKGESGKNLGWTVTETKVDEHDYPVDFPDGKRAPAVLRIHETSDEIMKKVTAVDKKLLKMGHHLILDGLKDSNKNYKFASPPWTPAMEIVGNMGDEKDNQGDSGTTK